ncbi:DUF6894 family protein [Methylobacterium sp. R2-1]|uniref:DUF6894 family protein n=1 Tax=Methylobacterium sp. R2-1 TaxID=2587064 RepID=UPI0016160FAC|nr:hypothetical protein [Methylobacterium sp. R2-1]MBB2961181.1 hypothetical protein [Methylobacterium sp. R2-1]
MPRYYIDTYDRLAFIDDEGHNLPNEAAARALVQRSLVAMAAEQAATRSSTHLRAEVRDEAGKRVVAASVTVSVEWTGGGGVQSLR